MFCIICSSSFETSSPVILKSKPEPVIERSNVIEEVEEKPKVNKSGKGLTLGKKKTEEVIY
jgi:hypothetical protein